MTPEALAAQPCEKLSPIAKPLASDKLRTRSLKLLKRVAEHDAAHGHKSRATTSLLRGAGEITKALRKDTKGIILFATDVFPIDVVSHLPVLAEEKGVPYTFCAVKSLLGCVSKSSRSSSVLLVRKPVSDEKLMKLYAKCEKDIKHELASFLAEL